MTGGQIPAGGIVRPGEEGSPPATDDPDLPFWELAAQIRQERPRWVVIWLARERRFRAYPRFRPPAGMTAANGTGRDELLADIDRIEQAADRPRGRSAAGGAP